MAENTSGNKTLTIVLSLIGAAILIGVILVFVLPKTSAAAPTSTPTQEEILATATSTATTQPSPTPLPPTATATSIPSPTPISALAMLENGFSVWCYPEEQLTAPPSAEGIAIAPEGEINKSTIVDGVPEVPIPNYSCNYVFEFNQKAPDGLTVEIYDWLQKKPIFNLPLTAAADKPTAAVLYTKNAYLQKESSGNIPTNLL